MRLNRVFSVLILFCFVFSQVTPFISLRAENINYVDDVIVDGDEVFSLENGVFNVNHIVVKDRGTLIIRNARVESRVGNEEYTVSAYDDADILILNSTIMNPMGEWAHSNILLQGSNVIAEIRDSVIRGYIISGGAGELNLINATFYYLGVSGDGTDIFVEDSTALMSNGYISGSSSLWLSDSQFKGFSLVFGTKAHPGPMSVELSLKNGFASYWAFNEESIFAGLFRLEIFDSLVNEWTVEVNSFKGKKNSLVLSDSEITSLAISEYSAVNVIDSKIGRVSTDGEVSSRGSQILSLRPSSKSSVFLDNSTVQVDLSFGGGQTITVSNVRPGFFDYFDLGDVVEGVNLRVVLSGSRVTAWTFETTGRTVVVLENSYINNGKIRSGGVLLSPTSTLETFRIDADATLVVQSLFDVMFPNGTAVRGAKVSVSRDNKKLSEAATNSEGKAIVSIVFKRGNQTLYTSKYNVTASFAISNSSRYSGVKDFFLTLREPIPVGTRFQHYLAVSSSRGSPAGMGWYDRGLNVTASANYVVEATEGSRYRLDSYVLDGKVVKVESAGSGTCSVSVVMDAPHIVRFNYTLQYYLDVRSRYGSQKGEGWYDAGSTAIFSVASPIGAVVQQAFTRWSGDSDAASLTATILMDGPKTVIANWRTDYTILYILFAASVVVLVVVVSVAYMVKFKKL